MFKENIKNRILASINPLGVNITPKEPLNVMPIT